MEKSSADLQSFLDKVRIGYGWLCDLYNMLAPEEQERDDTKSDGSDNQENKTMSMVELNRKQSFIIIMSDNLKSKPSEFLMKELSSDNFSRLERNTFKRSFFFDEDSNAYSLRNKHRSGVGFYSLANELLCFATIYGKKILTPQNIFDNLKYHPCVDETDITEVSKNFWMNFTTSFLYINFFNIVVLLVCLDKMKEEYIEGKTLRGVNPLIDLKTLLRIEDLYQFLDVYDYCDSTGKELITPEFFSGIKSRLVESMELMGVIEENIWALIDLNINTSYVNFILCITSKRIDFLILSRHKFL